MSELLECIEIETAPAPTAAVIWLHGLGADGNDFVPIVPELGLSDMPIRFIFPHAPRQAVTSASPSMSATSRPSSTPKTSASPRCTSG